MALPPRKRQRLEFQEGDIAFKFLVTPNGAAKIIGKGGSEVSRLRQEFGVAVHICDFSWPGTAMQIAVLSGPRASVDLAFGPVVEKISQDEQAPVKGNEYLMSLIMSRNAISKIIGTKGGTIKQLREQCGCNLAAESGGIKGEQLFNISSADPQQIAHCLSLLSPFVEESADSTMLAPQDYFDVAVGAPPGKGGKGWVQPLAYGKGKEWAVDPWAYESAGKGAFPGKGPESAKGWGAEGGKGGKVGKAWAADGKGKSHALNAVLPAAPQFSTEGMPLESAPENPDILESPASIQFAIPSSCVSKVLGKGGASAKEIRSLAGVTLNIDPGLDEGIVTVSGSVLGVHHAHCMVLQRVNSEY